MGCIMIGTLQNGFYCDWSTIYPQLNINMRPRSWHVAQSLHGAAVSTECEVAIFGGNVHIDRMWGDRTDAADLRILRFGWLCL